MNIIPKATLLIINEATRKEKVVPSGTPASRKPINKGVALQVQKEVTIPNSTATTQSQTDFFVFFFCHFLFFYSIQQSIAFRTNSRSLPENPSGFLSCLLRAFASIFLIPAAPLMSSVPINFMFKPQNMPYRS